MRVSVIVPVFDPGPDLERCIDSILGQSLWPAGIEAIFVDDGSTDDAPARLDALAAAHPNVRVVHTPNSGWPGRPRNIGLDLATGDFVMFVDADDRLGPEALERMVAMADRNHSDIVVGKVASDFRIVNLGVFRVNQPACTIHDAPLIYTLTPHKLFRRDLIERHGLRFPEGRQRLEDQQFVVRAYFAASVVSILADYPCYFYLERTDRKNVTFDLPEPFGYFADTRAVVDIVLANTEPGRARDRLVRRFVQVEMLRRISETNLRRLEAEDRHQLIAAVTPLLDDFATPGVLAGISPIGRVRAKLVAQRRPDAVIELAERASRWTARGSVDSQTWKGGRLEVSFRVEVVDRDGRPLTLERHRDRIVLDPALTDGLLADPLDVTDDLDRIRLTVTVRDTTTHVEWLVPTRTTVENVVVGHDPAGNERLAPMVRATARLDAGRLALGKPVDPGTWRVRLRLDMLGLDRRAGLATPPGGHPMGHAVVCAGSPQRIVRLAPGGEGVDGEVTLDVYAADDPRAPLVTRRARRAARARTVIRTWSTPARRAIRSGVARIRRRMLALRVSRR